MEMFWFKKLVGKLLMPLPLIIILSLLALFLYKRNKNRAAKSIVALNIMLLLLVTTPWLPNQLLGALEHQYPQFDQAQAVDVVVVLGCDHVNDLRVPLTSQLRACSLFRLTEGLRILRAHPNALLITSGGSAETFSNAETMRDLAIELGVPAQRIRMQTTSRDTEEEAQLLKPMLADKRFALVTSGYHMRRAMRIFHHAGMQPVAAPTEHLVKDSGAPRSWLGKFPSASHLARMELYIHETLGYWWLIIRGK